MKKFLHVAFGLLVSATAMAQQPAQKEQEFKTPEERAKFQTEKMASELQHDAIWRVIDESAGRVAENDQDHTTEAFASAPQR